MLAFIPHYLFYLTLAVSYCKQLLPSWGVFIVDYLNKPYLQVSVLHFMMRTLKKSDFHYNDK